MFIEVREVTPSLVAFEEKFNRQIQLVNCLAGQLYDQQQKMEQARTRVAYNKDKIENMDMQRKRLVNKIRTLAEKLIDTKVQLENTGFFDFKAKRRLRLELTGCEDQLNTEKNRFNALEADLAEAQKEIDEHPEKMAREYIPNFKMHIKQFKLAVAEYERSRETLSLLTGMQLPELKVQDIVESSPEGVIKIKKLEPIKYISFMVPYKSSELEI